MNAIYRHIRKICIKNILVAFFPLIIFSLPLFVLPFQEILSPVHVSSPASLVDSFQSKETYVEVTFPELHYTGYNLTSNRRITGSYYYYIEDGQVLFVLVSGKNDSPDEVLYHYTSRGKLVERDKNFRHIMDLLAADLNFSPQGISLVSRLFLLSENAYHITFYTYMFIYLIGTVIVLVVFILINLVHFAIPETHSSLIKFRILTKRTHLPAVLHELEEPDLKAGKIYFTKHYFVAFPPSNLVLLPIKSIVWVYENSKLHHLFWIKLKMSYNLHIVCRHKIKSVITGIPKEDFDSLTGYLAEHYPDILIGYTRKNKKSAK